MAICVSGWSRGFGISKGLSAVNTLHLPRVLFTLFVWFPGCRTQHARNTMNLASYVMVFQRRLGLIVLLEFLIFALGDSKTIKFELGGEQGSFTSSNYPSIYQFNITTLWLIRSPQGTILTLNFTEFKVEKNKKCLYDFVIITNGNGDQTRKYCGNQLPPAYVSDNNKILVTFVSDKSTADKGFRARWTAIHLKGGRPTSSFATSKPAQCVNHVTVTMKPQGCTENIKPAAVATGAPCSCLPTRTTVIKEVFVTRSKEVASDVKTTSYVGVHKASSRVLDHKVSNRIPVNASDPSCSPGSQKYEKASKSKKNQALVIWLGALVAAFLFTDILLLFLWCRLHKRRSQHRGRPCQTEVSAVELKVIGGQTTSPTRTKPRRVKICEKKKAPSHNRQLIDTNGNSRRGRGTNGILKGKHSLLPQDQTRFISGLEEQ